MKKVQTLCLIYQPPKILLGFKKRGFGVGRWNGFGGKVKVDESIEQSAVREVKEETGVVLKNLEKRGIITFEFADDPEVIEVHFFSSSDFSGQPTESEEMKPQWFDVSEIPYQSMWPDDQYWLPMFLAGKNFKGSFYFSDKNNILNHYLEEVKIL